MTIRKRLFISNILMVLVPLAITLLFGSVSIAAIWYIAGHGSENGFEDVEDFSRVSKKLVNKVEKSLYDDPNDFTDVQEQLEKRKFTLLISEGETEVYRYGNPTAEDEDLLSAISTLKGGDILVSKGKRNLYVRKTGSYLIQMYGSNGRLSNTMMMWMTTVIVLIGLSCILFSIFLTDRFLMKFVFRRIQEPIDLLTDAVSEVEDGNLDIRIDYPYDDEFRPACNAFNNMTRRMAYSARKSATDEKSRKELLAGISHDLRSPLMAIQAYVEALMDGMAEDEATRKTYLTTIRDKSEDINHMVSQLFLLSKMEMDDYPIQMETLRFDRFLEDCVRADKPEMQRQGLDLTLEAKEPCWVTIDPKEFLRVIQNVENNSLKYRKKETVRLTLNLKKQDGWCTLTLGDDGPGVSRDEVSRIFDPFYRSDPSRRDPHTASGLGLTVVRTLVRRMGGTISAGLDEEGGLELKISFKEVRP